MTWYRKKPVAVEAVKASVLMHDAEHQWEHLPPWIKAAYDLSDVTFTGERILIRTLEGVMAAGLEELGDQRRGRGDLSLQKRRIHGDLRAR